MEDRREKLRQLENMPSMKLLRILFLYALFGTLIGALVYLVQSSMSVGLYYRKASRLVLCIVVACIVGRIVLWKCKKKFDDDVFKDILIGIGIYECITYWNYYLSWIVICVAFVMIVTIVNIILVWKEEIIRKEHRERVMNKRKIQCVLMLRRNLRTLAILITVVITVVSVYSSEKGNSNENIEAYKNKIISGETQYDNNYRVIKNMETIKYIQSDETWKPLSLKKKCEVLEACMRCELEYLGIEKNVHIIFTENMNPGLEGCYNANIGAISVNITELETMNCDKALDTVLHEARHCYQHAMCDFYNRLPKKEKELAAFREIAIWAENFDNYIEYRYEDSEYYFMQPVEEDARNYAATAKRIYHKEIVEYMNGK